MFYLFTVYLFSTILFDFYLHICFLKRNRGLALDGWGGRIWKEMRDGNRDQNIVLFSIKSKQNSKKELKGHRKIKNVSRLISDK